MGSDGPRCFHELRRPKIIEEKQEDPGGGGRKSGDIFKLCSDHSQHHCFQGINSEAPEDFLALFKYCHPETQSRHTFRTDIRISVLFRHNVLIVALS